MNGVRTPLTSRLLEGQEFLCPDYSFFINSISPHSYQVLVIYVVIVGRQKGTESKARLPDNVTLGKDLQFSMLQLPHLEDEDNNICLRNIVIIFSITENTMQTVPGTQSTQGHVQ